jgi:hypothetical protein
MISDWSESRVVDQRNIRIRFYSSTGNLGGHGRAKTSKKEAERERETFR